MRPQATPPSLRVAILGGRHVPVVEQIIRALPERVGLALVVACPTDLDLASLLRPVSMLPITAVRGRTPLEHDRVFVLPTEVDVYLQRGELVVDASSRVGWSLDKLFRSLADELGRYGVAVIAGGRGSDGAHGIKRVKGAGGLTLAVTPTDDSPEGDQARAAIATGMVDLVLPSSEIAGRLLDQGQERAGAIAALDDDDRDNAGVVADTLRDILAMLRTRSGHDFNAYKRATLYRRVARRMQVCRTDSIVAYHQYLREHPGELMNLLRDFLISVTNFFRDPEVFEALERNVIPKLFIGKQPADQVRVWVVGCATGEEAYSIGMLLAEQAGRFPEPPQLQVFATDIDDHALAEARAGIYPDSISAEVSEKRLARFFNAEAGGYRVTKELREIMLFSPHNILRDPPFSRLDLISCRNLLIYLNREAQDRALNLFHFGLRPDGFLMLGSSESAENVSLLFAVLDAKHRIYTRRLAPTTLGVDAMVNATGWLSAPPMPLPVTSSERVGSFGELHHRLVERYAPPSVIVNEDLEVVHVSEHAGKFLRLGGGEPTRQLLRLVHPSLRLDLRTAIYTARQGQGGDTRVVRFDDEGKARAIELRVQAFELPEMGRYTMLVMFHELDSPVEDRPPPRDVGIEPVVRELEDELHRTRDQLRSTIEQYEIALEELKASNEELHAINEELRSATEELETSKEELQSVNEELITLNHELKVKVDEVSRANSDLQNLMTSTDIGVVFLDRSLNIKRFTPRAKDLFNVIGSDIGRPLVHLTHRLSTDELPDLANDVLQSLRTVEREVQSRNGHRFLARLLPYRAMDDRIEGVVMTFVDVTDLKEAIEARRRSEAALRASEERLQLALHAAPMVALSLDSTQRVRWAFALGTEQEPSRMLEMFAPGHADRFITIVRHVVASRAGQRAELDLAVDGRPRTYDFRIEPSSDGVAAVGFDITPSKLAETGLLEADRRKDEFLATLSHELRNPLTPLTVALEVARRSENDPEQRARARAIMERQVALLTQLVDELLDLSRITQGKMQIERVPLDPASIVEAALESTRPLLQEHGHRLSVRTAEHLPRVLGDHRRLVQVLTNLLTNAIKYTPDGGQIELEIEPAPGRGVLLVRVRDNGVGIPADVLPHVFDIFVQGSDSLGRSQGGLGIGLNLVRRLVELHGGSVHASSAGENRGSEFVIEIPTAT
jgi:two-component system, chemotaxis family, CheB/CheR fusion protein